MKAIIKVICNALERDNTAIRTEMAELLKKEFADYEQVNQKLRVALLEASDELDRAYLNLFPASKETIADKYRSIAQNKE